MKTEPTAIIEVIRLVAYLVGFFGVVVTIEEQAIIAGGIGGLLALVSVVLAIWNRQSVFSQKTTERVAEYAATTGQVPADLKPPEGGLPPTPPEGDTFRG